MVVLTLLVKHHTHYFRDPPIPIHKLIQPMESYNGDNSLGKQIEQSRVTLSIAKKMLERQRKSEKTL